MKSWFIKDDATAAIEFALVGFPFMVMLIGIVEACLFFSTAVSLEGATQDAARLIRTGQVQAAANPIQTFESQMCQQISGLVSCGALQYQVLPIDDNNFANAAGMTPEFDEEGNLLNQGFDPGSSNQDVLIRVVYQYVFLTPFMGRIMTGGQATQALLMSTIVIKNEPYKFGE